MQTSVKAWHYWACFLFLKPCLRLDARGPRPGVFEGSNAGLWTTSSIKKKKKKISSSYPISEKASQANETAERLCSWLESHPTRAVPWLPQAAEKLISSYISDCA